MEKIIGKPWRTKSSILVHSGKYLDIMDPQEDSIEIEDIARGLARQARFGGHSKVLYTVAQHSIECSLMVKDELKIEALLHDASEAYLGDIPTPYKQYMPKYLEFETNLMNVIASKYGFNWPVSDDVHVVDRFMFQLEWNQYSIGDKIEGVPTDNFTLLTPEQAEKEFLRYFKEYTK
jgi:hypothetical protein